MKDKYKDQIIISVILTISLLAIGIMLDRFLEIPFNNLGIIIISIQVLFLTIIMIKNSSDNDKEKR
jgi:hypothetical protein